MERKLNHQVIYTAIYINSGIFDQALYFIFNLIFWIFFLYTGCGNMSKFVKKCINIQKKYKEMLIVHVSMSPYMFPWHAIGYATFFLDFSRLGRCTEVGTGYETHWA